MTYQCISASLAALLLSASPAFAQSKPASDPATQTSAEGPAWPFESSDVSVDPGFVFGTLPNGMRYIIRQNATPEGTALVRMRIGSGSLSETDSERGLAHFIEHMAFNGTTNVPEGEMVKLLEREGLAFGADTNASTGFDETIYKLNLPRNDETLLDTALMLMRETASELTIDPDAVDRERGIVLAERRDRRNFAQANTEDQFEFTTPGARYTQRLPIGTPEVLENASAADLRGFYEREYVPANTVLVVVGDFDPTLVEMKIRERFADWQAAPAPAEPVTGPIDTARNGLTDIYLDPALSEQVVISRQGNWRDEPDSIASRQRGLLRRIGYGIVNRRLASLARLEDAPFRSAGFGTGEIFEDARTTRLVVNSPDGEWEKGVRAAGLEYRRALQFGFTRAELNEQLANIRTAQENAVSSADTRSHGALTGAALALVDQDIIPSTPASSLARFEEFAPQITPESVLAALAEETVPLGDPLIRFVGRQAPAGGEVALRSAWNSVQAAEIAAPEIAETAEFAYTDFGAPGMVVSDATDDRLGYRTIRFANNVLLNYKQTDLAKDRISFHVGIDGGDLLDTKDNPLATALTGAIAAGGLGAHSQDELQSILAGRSVAYGIGSHDDHFGIGGTTTQRDLELQLQVATALLTDRGYRPEAERQFQRSITNFFANLDATPGRVLGNNFGRIASDGDPRFSLQGEEAFEKLTFAKLEADIGEQLAGGAIEIAIVGDIDPQTAIALVAKTFGALPQREADFEPRKTARERSFTENPARQVLYHSGEEDQAMLDLTWPTTDDSDQAEDTKLSLLARIMRLQLTEELRERLGQAYSPSASSRTSSIYRGYGTFDINASLDLEDVEAGRTAILAAVEKLRSEPVDTDMLDRARRPVLDAYDNALKNNGFWLSLIESAQSDQSRIERYHRARTLAEAVTVQELQATAARYLVRDNMLELLIVPTKRETNEEEDSDGEPGQS